MVGTSIGPYRVVRKLGAGGMGEVYLAEDPRLDRAVALKTLSGNALASKDARASLLREARAAARLSHPNIAAVYDVIDQGDRLHIVMEYVEGETAAARARRERLPVAAVVDIAIQLADALAHAHAHGIIHRDLKPGNLVLTPDGKVKVLDFGLAKIWRPAGAPAATSPDSAEVPVIAGTPPYIAPERLFQRHGDHRADLYSVGVILFELLTGRHPFEATDYGDLAIALVTEKPPAPDAIDPRVPPSLSAVVVRALARDPHDRYASAAELRRELSSVASELSGGETRAVGEPPVRAVAPPPRLKRRLVALTVSFTIAIAAWAIWAAVSRPSRALAFRERDWVLVADFENQTGEPLFDHTLRATLETALQQSKYVNVVPRDRMFDGLRRMRRPDLARVDESVALELGRRENIRAVLAGTALGAGGTFRISVRAVDTSRGELLFEETQQFRRKDELFDRFDALARAVRERLGESVSHVSGQTQPLARVTTGSLEALQFYSRAVDAASRGRLEESRDLLEAALARDAEFAMGHLRLGGVYSGLGQFAKTLEHYDRAYALRDRVTAREAQMIASTYYQARDESEKAVASWRVLTTLYPDDVTARYELAKGLYESGDLKAAIPALRTVLTLNPYHAAANSTLVLSLARIDRPEEASKAYEQAAARAVETPYLHWGFGLAQLAMNRADLARETLARLASGGGTYEGFADLFLAQCDAYEGKLTAAVDRLEAGFALDRRSGNVANQLLRHYLSARAALLRRDRVLAARHAQAIVAHEDTQLFAQNYYQAGTLFVRLGDPSRARQTLRRLADVAAKTPSGFRRTLVDTLRGEVALLEGRTEDAAIAFESAAGGYPKYEAYEGLARVHERRGEWRQAREAWQRVVDSRGHILQVGFAADWPLATLQLARACREEGNLACARDQYEKFLGLWQQADDLPVRREASAELRQILEPADLRRPGRGR